MLRMYGFGTVLVLCMLANTTFAVGPACTSCEQYNTLGAPACSCPSYDLVPGCCEFAPTGCENAWAGYCESRARCNAFRAKVGTGYYCRGCRCDAGIPCGASYSQLGTCSAGCSDCMPVDASTTSVEQLHQDPRPVAPAPRVKQPKPPTPPAPPAAKNASNPFQRLLRPW